jgi:hypothetical protein
MLLRYLGVDELIGRLLAICAHPHAAWRSRSVPARVIVLSGYLVAGYVVTLSALLTF